MKAKIPERPQNGRKLKIPKNTLKIRFPENPKIDQNRTKIGPRPPKNTFSIRKNRSRMRKTGPGLIFSVFPDRFWSIFRFSGNPIFCVFLGICNFRPFWGLSGIFAFITVERRAVLYNSIISLILYNVPPRLRNMSNKRLPL